MGYLIAFLIISTVFFFLFIYNSLVTHRQKVKYAWLQVETELKHRSGLLAELLSELEAYTPENEIVMAAVDANSRALVTAGISEWGKAYRELGQMLESLLKPASCSASPPEGAAHKLLEECKEAEARIDRVRRHYNIMVQRFNSSIELFPIVIVTRLFGFTPYEELAD